jgi:hypothetical protein
VLAAASKHASETNERNARADERWHWSVNIAVEKALLEVTVDAARWRVSNYRTRQRSETNSERHRA